MMLNSSNARRAVALCLAASLAGLPVSAGSAPKRYQITNYVGNGVAGSEGDTGLATSTELNYPAGLTLTSKGFLYIADQGNHRIRVVDTNNYIGTIIGTGVNGYSGDSGDPLDAELRYPSATLILDSGYILVADTLNHIIRSAKPGGQIFTWAGNSTAGFSGDYKADGPDTDLNADVSGVATSAQLYRPTDLARDSIGNIFIADSNNNRIRRVDHDDLILTIAGSSSTGYSGDEGRAIDAALSHPTGIVIDAKDNLYIADKENHRIRKVTLTNDPDTTIISTIAGTGDAGFGGDGGLAVNAKLNYPCCVALDGQGNLLIGDTSNNRLRRLDLSTGVISTIAGNGKFGDTFDGSLATTAKLRFPTYMTVRSTDQAVFFSDSNNNRVKLLVPVTENVTYGPTLDANGVSTEAAYGALASPAPGSWIELRGVNLATATRSWTAADFVNGQAPTVLEGTYVMIGGQPAYIGSVSPTLVRAQVPSTALTGKQTLTLTTPYGTTPNYTVTISATQPALQTPYAFYVGGKQYLAAQFSDGTYAMPKGTVSGVTSRAAVPGEVLTIYGEGFGDVTPAVTPGTLVSSDNALVNTVTVKFGDATAEVVYAGLARNEVGKYMFRVVVPSSSPSGTVQVRFFINGSELMRTAYVAVSN
jgi:uncharacterized protein (TIGR03437 family)